MSLIIVLICVTSIDVDTISPISIEEIKEAYEAYEKRKEVFPVNTLQYRPLFLEDLKACSVTSHKGIEPPVHPKEKKNFFHQKDFILFDEKRKTPTYFSSDWNPWPNPLAKANKGKGLAKHFRQKK